MLISEIKNKEVRERAEFYARTIGRRNEQILGAAFYWCRTDDGEEIDLPPAVHAKFDMPRLPASWRYTREYRQPVDGEYYQFHGEVKFCKGRTAGWYPIVERAE